MNSNLLMILIIAGLLSLGSCGGDGGSSGGGAVVQNQDQDRQDQDNDDDDRGDGDSNWKMANSFGRRINPNLLIEGKKCEGGERSGLEEEGMECAKGQWLVTIDDMNTCTTEGDDGICTQIFVPPFVARLERSRTTSDFRYYEIKPEETVPSDVAQILEEYWVRFRANGTARVQQRD